ncbi:MAG: hypothetical protein AVDCRST_MAG40-2106 [uncultured Gemmatimonadaceae bacterium]|uniref:Uncharacterized protein n=1 Tax=uncultured Gemmatimonadaceae bacterium TaxID=246130 RepID=A0A6J4LPT3_9BACT|nr:MAG: hypothetical protein AVDCRST_MAG40-2106 [uncultured Gemmatimonadaceae bacterium]
MPAALSATVPCPARDADRHRLALVRAGGICHRHERVVHGRHVDRDRHGARRERAVVDREVEAARAVVVATRRVREVRGGTGARAPGRLRCDRVRGPAALQVRAGPRVACGPLRARRPPDATATLPERRPLPPRRRPSRRAPRIRAQATTTAGAGARFGRPPP